MTCILKCFCLVLLCFIPIFSLHFDFIIWTYCMSRCFCWMLPPAGHKRNNTFTHADSGPVKAESVFGDRLSSVNRALTFAPPAQSSVLPQNSAHGVLVVGRHQRSLGSEALLVVPHQGAMAHFSTWRQRQALAFTSTDGLSSSSG